MKTLRTIALLSLLGSLAVAHADGHNAQGKKKTIRLSEPVAVTESHEVFGAPLDVTSEPVSLSDAIAGGDRYMDSEFFMKTRITKVCQKKGCFFIAKDGQHYARVSFKDYGFFIPTDSSGKTVVIKGVMSRQQVTEEQAQHFAEDLGDMRAKDAAAKVEFHIVASSISIPKS